MIRSFNEKLISYLVLISGLSVSAVAVYYSVIGLTAIFAAAIAPVIIMGIVLEVSKLVATLWLKQNWSIAPKFIKYYLTTAVIVLMLITSMGIFGFLSKAHIEQTATTQENQAQIERLTQEIQRQQQTIQKAEQQIKNIETSGTGQDAQIQTQIDREQARIDIVLKRIEPAVKEQNDIIDSQIKIYRDQFDVVSQNLNRLQSNLDRNDIVSVQSQIGVEADGRIGPRTTAAIRDYRNRLEEQKKQLSAQLEQINNTPAIKTARQEIQRIRSEAAKEVADSNQLISRLRSQLGQTQKQNVDQLIDAQRTIITKSNQELETLIEKKYQIESEFRKLEAEVGPIKYIAQFVYGRDADKNLLEKAVTWVIILLVLVFDPLAIILLLASQISFQNFRQTKNSITKSNFSNFNFNNYSFLTDPILKKSSNEKIDKTVEKELVEIQKEKSKTVINPEIVEKAPVPVFEKQESKNVKIKVFKRKENSTATVITPEVYQSISKDKSQEGNE